MPKRSSDRVSQESYTQDRPVLENVLREAREAVLNALILNPKMPAAQLAIIVLQNVDSDLLWTLKDILVIKFLQRTIRAERRKQTTGNRAQLVFPGFELLPPVIPLSEDGPTADLIDARYSDLRAYCKLLGKRQSERLRNDPRLKQARALRDKMRHYAQREPGITVRQVLLLEQL